MHILAFGAHPDDCDIVAGGTAALFRSFGHRVKFVSVTNGESGHHKLSGEELVRIRKQEAQAAGSIIGVEYDVLDYPDGRLEPIIQAREEIIAIIRKFQPDLVLTHRPNDYHPDHRYTSQLVCDAAYMVTVPPIVPEVPALRTNPVFMYFADRFRRPYPFSPDVVVDIDPVLDRVVDMLDCHRSQFYEWLAYNHQYENELPEEPAEQRSWLKERYQQRTAWVADRFRSKLTESYGREHSHRIKCAEAFELCEYGQPLGREDRRRLFPFLPE
ncbi:MAG: hypothetical protein Tsb009_09160 [Planctomycetaceae bacterium]